MTHSRKNEIEQREISSTSDEREQRYTSSALGLGKCDVHIRIKHVDTINICNCAPGPKIQSPDEAADQQIDYSDCIPFVEGHKTKQNSQIQLGKFLANNKVPSVLAATFFHQARRFLQGLEPANELEVRAFAIFAKLPTSTLEILECALKKYDADPRRSQLFSPEIEQLRDVPITAKQLTSFVAEELVRRASVYYFDDPDCFDSERPGLFRQRTINDDVGSVLIISISAVNGLRTNGYSPALSLGEYRVEEIQQVCTPEIQGESVVMNCKPQTENCPGNSVDGVCLRVPEVQQGEAVLLQGTNYFSVDGKVRLTAKEPGTVERVVDALVCGDTETGLTEIINGTERLIEDSRVKDQILFTVPSDLPAGVYGINVIMPLDGVELSSQQQFIRVLSPSTTTYQIASEELKAINETSPSWLGSDEVGIKILSTAITSDGELGEISTIPPFKFNDLDSGNTRDMSRVLFQQNNIASVVIAIIGHEIDNDKLYEKEVEAFEDAFVEVLKSNWAAISGALGSAGGAAALALGLSAGWVAAIGTALTLAINLLVAYFGRADLIIEDTIALSALDLEARTSVNFPAPEPTNYTSPGGIDVTTEALNNNIQYAEKREYVSDDEGSKYRITIHYNRVQ